MASLSTDLASAAVGPPLRLTIHRRKHESALLTFAPPPCGDVIVLASFDDEWALPAVGVVRRELKRFLACSSAVVDESLIDDVVLCAHEVLTNALIHTDSRLVTVNARVCAGTARGTVARVIVGDEERRRPMPRVAGEGEFNTRGRGLSMLSTLARWGCRRCRYGKYVWFECPRPVTAGKLA